MRGADLIREARTRAGLTQDELAELSKRPRSLIARWEQGTVDPSVDNFLAIIEACGYELPLDIVKRDKAFDGRLEKNRQLSPERRAQRLLGQIDKSADGDG
jgi:transcriptional regulator with XRE-family HTH domain